MTREDNILSELNHGEQTIKAILEREVVDEAQLNETIAYMEGMRTMLRLLGYVAVEDADNTENVNDYWIYAYKAIEDRR